ncbi:tryptophan 2,3-dioxygenase [Sphingomonas sp.]|uniref:tryptophan 2,3-dioxygenase n=1 Tax=Sphingomonas sp. TaxID=28214 RepID=UPI002C424C10|nr:tryptophan 2,3-dioxygenase family protein [Sphingomonas sp.]HTG38435.1 tryptophan 2,3-dioxygenase family protein [Sphingomonas sp.]
MARSMTYGDYLALGTLLDAQRPISDHPDEPLFIAMHQTQELWMKQAIHELEQALALIRADRLAEVYKVLARVSRIQSVMTASWDVLTTMTAIDYTRFRDVLGTSSGFQSDQFRTIEVMMGFRGGPRHGPMTHAAAAKPSLWDEANAALARAGLPVPNAALARDWAAPYVPDPGVEAAWTSVYRDERRWWSLYQLAEKLVDLDESFASWRHKHVLTVSRIIGHKRGTGGTGVHYLESTLPLRAFPELWSLRTLL